MQVWWHVRQYLSHVCGDMQAKRCTRIDGVQLLASDTGSGRYKKQYYTYFFFDSSMFESFQEQVVLKP
jgi:hypothetical protein